MQREGAEPSPILSPSSQLQDLCLPFLQDLTLEDKTMSLFEADMVDAAGFGRVNAPLKTKAIDKGDERKRAIKQKSARSKLTNRKKTERLQTTIRELELQNDRLRRRIQGCSHCSRRPNENGPCPPWEGIPDELSQFAGTPDSERQRGSHGSLQFENVEFHGPALNRENDDKLWVYLGTLMVAMGSKCLDVDGTINVFKVLKESVDSLRRQVQKSEPNISLDFYISKEEMGESPYMQEIGFDPFTQKTQEQGLCLEGVKVESVEQFELTYDSKVSFNLRYEALLGAMEYIRENYWVV